MSQLLRKLLTLPATLEKTALKRSTLYVMVAGGEFPKPVKIGPRRIAFVESEVNDWVASRIATRDAGEAGTA